MDLERHAAAIPSMGGRQIGPILRNLARAAPADTAIVELGAWLGSGTAQLALGLRDRSDNRVSIHCFDRWTVLESEVRKAKLEGVSLAVGQPTLPIVQETLEPFGVPITFTQGDLRNAKWSGPPISVYIDDATKTAEVFLPTLKEFGPHWIPGVTMLVLMDFHFWKKTGNDAFKAQKNFIDAHPDNFEHIADPFGSVALFRYVKALDFDTIRSPAKPPIWRRVVKKIRTKWQRI
jgi:hypothetical protein